MLDFCRVEDCLTCSEGYVLRRAGNLLLPCVFDRTESHVVVLSWIQFTDRIGSHFSVWQEAAPGVQPSGYVDHKAIRDVSRGATPGDHR